MSRTLDLTEIYQVIYDVLQSELRCGGLFVSSYDPAERLIRCGAAWIDGSPVDVGMLPPIPLEPEGSGTQSRVIRSGEPLLVDDYDAFVRTSRSGQVFINEAGEVYDALGDDEPRTRSAVLVPLILDGVVTGVIQAFSYELDHFDQADLELVEALSHHAAASIANASLYQRLQRESAEKEEAQEEQRQLELRMIEARRLESLGLLAAAVAHDFNNLLMGIMGQAENLLGELDSSSPLRAPVDRIVQGVRNGSALTRQMLAIAGRGSVSRGTVDLGRLVADMAELLRVSVPKSGTLAVNAESETHFVEGDAGQLEQVVMNLVMNAADSLGDSGGQIHVRVGRVLCTRADFEDALLGEGLEEGDYELVEVADTGCGMTTEVQRRIFDPFFSTKKAGRGLGLAGLLGIVRGHGGAVRLSSEAGRGSTFRIYLPQSSVRASGGGPTGVGGRPAAVGAAAAADSEADAWTGSGTVLLVDDEDSVRVVCRRMLERLGFEVLAASDGVEALERLRSGRQDVVAVLSDLSMPRMDGVALARALREQGCSAPVILSSGYPGGETVLSDDGIAAFIQKPYQLHELRAVLGAVLER